MREIVGDLAAEISVTELRDQDLLSKRYEDDDALELIAARSNETFVPATDETIHRIFTDFESIVKARSEAE